MAIKSETMQKSDAKQGRTVADTRTLREKRGICSTDAKSNWVVIIKPGRSRSLNVRHA